MEELASEASNRAKEAEEREQDTEAARLGAAKEMEETQAASRQAEVMRQQAETAKNP